MTIRIITEPSIYLLGRPSIDQAELARFLDAEGFDGWTTDAPSDGEALIEIAGRNCYQSFSKPRPGGNKGYLGHILESGHGSVVEHSVYNMIVTGVSRSLTHELIRHRAGFGYSELSQRFVDSGDVAFVPPPALIDEVGLGLRFIEDCGGDYGYVARLIADVPIDSRCLAGLHWILGVRQDAIAYQLLADYLATKPKALHPEMTPTLLRKRAREAARSVLPNCTETKIFVTANARALRHFLEMRGHEQADAEIHRFAVKLLSVLQSASPNVFGDYAVTDTPDGPRVETPHRKV